MMSKLLDKIWMFYTNEKSLGYNSWHIYAITNQKELAKQFMEERNMNKFKIKKYEDDHETWKELARECGDAILDIHYLQTKKKTRNNTYSVEQVPILCTMYEYQTVDADFAQLDITTEGFWQQMPGIDMYTNKLIKSLNVLEYQNFHKLFAPYAALPFNDDDPDYSAPNFDIDEVGILISTFSKLFAK